MADPASPPPADDPAAAAAPDDRAMPPLVVASIKGLCPRCAAPTLFAGAIRFADRCRVCGLDIAGFDVGDGPAAFLTLILGTIVVALAIALELTVHPPLWVHMLIWIPVTLAGVVLLLRVAKAALLWAEYRARVRGGSGA